MAWDLLQIIHFSRDFYAIEKVVKTRALSVAIRIALVVAVVTGAMTIMATPKRPSSSRVKAFYLSPSDELFIRPGVVVKITSAQIGSDGTITAQFTLADSAGSPLDINGVSTPGSN